MVLTGDVEATGPDPDIRAEHAPANSVRGGARCGTGGAVTVASRDHRPARFRKETTMTANAPSPDGPDQPDGADRQGWALKRLLGLHAASTGGTP
jgi:hypothetical protein